MIIGSPKHIRAFVDEAFVQPGAPFTRDPENVNDKDFPLIDFELIVPQPENIERGGCGGGAVNGIHEDTGEVCWYQWNVENWGTKWGPYSHSHYQLRHLDGGEGIYARVDLRFETAWSQPTPIFEAIEQRWNVKVHAVTQDEGGYPDVEYGDPFDEDVLSKNISFEFEAWDPEVDEPAEVHE